MAWDPPCDLGSVILELYLLSFCDGSAVVLALGFCRTVGVLEEETRRVKLRGV